MRPKRREISWLQRPEKDQAPLDIFNTWRSTYEWDKDENCYEIYLLN